MREEEQNEKHKEARVIIPLHSDDLFVEGSGHLQMSVDLIHFESKQQHFVSAQDSNLNSKSPKFDTASDDTITPPHRMVFDGVLSAY